MPRATDISPSALAMTGRDRAAVSRVACERVDGLLNVHDEQDSCELCFPQRIQLRRTAGWRLQEESWWLNGRPAINVARPGPWGNPFSIGKPGPLGRCAIDAIGAVGFFEQMLRDDELRHAAGYPADLSTLRGYNLACWCQIGCRCHADVLLELANA